MSAALKAVLIWTALFSVPTVGVGYVYYNAALTSHDWVYEGPDRTKSESWKDGGVHGAPGPIAGAGLPVIAIGYGAFWLYRRYRRRPD
jgi:hypothetical protein